MPRVFHICTSVTVTLTAAGTPNQYRVSYWRYSVATPCPLATNMATIGLAAFTLAALARQQSERVFAREQR